VRILLLALLALASAALQRERRSQEVAAEPLAPVTIVAVDPDAGVQREYEQFREARATLFAV
jgi:hypothetical protein